MSTKPVENMTMREVSRRYKPIHDSYGWKCSADSPPEVKMLFLKLNCLAAGIVLWCPGFYTLPPNRAEDFTPEETPI